jgi:hypothetical protein
MNGDDTPIDRDQEHRQLFSEQFPIEEPDISLEHLHELQKELYRQIVLTGGLSNNSFSAIKRKFPTFYNRLAAKTTHTLYRKFNNWKNRDLYFESFGKKYVPLTSIVASPVRTSRQIASPSPVAYPTPLASPQRFTSPPPLIDNSTMSDYIADMGTFAPNGLQPGDLGKLRKWF